MDPHTLKKSFLYSAVFTLVCSIDALFVPTHYEQLLNEMISDLEKKNKELEAKIASFSARVKGKNSSITNQGNRDILGFLKDKQTRKKRRLQILNNEKAKLKREHPIKSSKLEELSIKKAHISNSVDDLNDQLSQAQRSQEFFKKQQSETKSKAAKQKFEGIINKWAQQAKSLQSKIATAENDLATINNSINRA